jgi:hypothetical protein
MHTTHLNSAACPRLLANVKLALEKLHDACLVFDGLRRPNIMVVKSRDEGEGEGWQGLLTDFDWAVPVGDAKYPPTLNISGDIDWADGSPRRLK